MTHPITPPPELVQQWWEKAEKEHEDSWDVHAAVSAARWGADQELEACCKWLRSDGLFEARIGHLRAARRPKPPSLKQQALDALEEEDDALPLRSLRRGERFALIRRALESIPDPQD